MAGFAYAPFGDLKAVERLIDDETAALMVEPVQGEGGINLPPPEFLPGLRRLADEHGLLLIFDEVQTGCGRTGRWFAYQHFGVTPDVMTLAKALCGGVAGGALLTRPEIAPSLRPGMHAATFGGNPLAARAGLAALEMIEQEGLLAHAQALSAIFRRRLDDVSKRCDVIRQVRIVGLMIGIELSLDGAWVVEECLKRQLLVNCTHGTVIRLLPAMNLTAAQAEAGLDILGKVLENPPAS
jgi:acetylornithine/succinyldiaminopimelate/putrescine aminotransferase